jgi:hypothetical protein
MKKKHELLKRNKNQANSSESPKPELIPQIYSQ